MPADLLEAQTLLAKLIRAPRGVDAALSSDPSIAAALEGCVRSDQRLAAARRLDVYANAYFFRLHDILAEDFSALSRALGAEAFNDLIAAYLWVCPSREPSVRHVGGRLPEFIEQAPGLAWLRQRYPWAADLARLEAALQDAFDAAEAPVARREDLSCLKPSAFAELSLCLVPSARCLELAWPLIDVRRALLRDEASDLDTMVRETERVLIWRREESVQVRRLVALEAECLAAVRRNEPFGALCVLAAESLGEHEGPGQAARWLARWVGDGCLMRPAWPPR